MGGSLTSALLLADADHVHAVLRAAQTTWHAPSVPLPLSIRHLSKHSPEEAQRLRNLMHCFLPSVEGPRSEDDPTESGLVCRHATVLTPGQLAAYVAPKKAASANVPDHDLAQGGDGG